MLSDSSTLIHFCKNLTYCEVYLNKGIQNILYFCPNVRISAGVFKIEMKIKRLKERRKTQPYLGLRLFRLWPSLDTHRIRCFSNFVVRFGNMKIFGKLDLRITPSWLERGGIQPSTDMSCWRHSWYCCCSISLLL